MRCKTYKEWIYWWQKNARGEVGPLHGNLVCHSNSLRRAPASHSLRRAPASNSPRRAPANHSFKRAPASNSPWRAPASHRPKRPPASHRPKRPPASNSPWRAPASHRPKRPPASNHRQVLLAYRRDWWTSTASLRYLPGSAIGMYQMVFEQSLWLGPISLTWKLSSLATETLQFFTSSKELTVRSRRQLTWICRSRDVEITSRRMFTSTMANMSSVLAAWLGSYQQDINPHRMIPIVWISSEQNT